MGDEHSALERYLATVGEGSWPAVRALDAAIRSAGTDFDVEIKYRILMYTLQRDWRRWVVAIDAHPRPAVALRFLYGVLLADPNHRLRAGTSVLKTWDVPRDAPVDADAVRAYVSEAVRRYPDYAANEKAVLAESRAAPGRAPSSDPT